MKTRSRRGNDPQERRPAVWASCTASLISLLTLAVLHSACIEVKDFPMPTMDGYGATGSDASAQGGEITIRSAFFKANYTSEEWTTEKLVVADIPDLCAKLDQDGASSIDPGHVAFVLWVPRLPGEYEVAPLEGAHSWPAEGKAAIIRVPAGSLADRAKGDGDYAGTVTLIEVTRSRISGFFEASGKPGKVKGVFDAVACPGQWEI